MHGRDVTWASQHINADTIRSFPTFDLLSLSELSIPQCGEAKRLFKRSAESLKKLIQRTHWVCRFWSVFVGRKVWSLAVRRNKIRRLPILTKSLNLFIHQASLQVGLCLPFASHF